MDLKSIAMPRRRSTASSTAFLSNFFIKLELANLQKTLNFIKQSSKSRPSPFLLENSTTSKQNLRIFLKSYQKVAKMCLKTYKKASPKRIRKKVCKKCPKKLTNCVRTDPGPFPTPPGPQNL